MFSAVYSDLKFWSIENIFGCLGEGVFTNSFRWFGDQEDSAF